MTLFTPGRGLLTFFRSRPVATDAVLMKGLLCGIERSLREVLIVALITLFDLHPFFVRTMILSVMALTALGKLLVLFVVKDDLGPERLCLRGLKDDLIRTRIGGQSHGDTKHQSHHQGQNQTYHFTHTHTSVLFDCINLNLL